MNRIQKIISRLTIVTTVLALLLGLSPVAHAQFPGDNGRILWVGNHYFTAKPDGSNKQDTGISHIPIGESSPPWEGIYTPDGAYIIYADDDVAGANNLFITNASNTITPVKLTNFTDCYAINPAVNSDYTKLAFSAYCTSSSTEEIYVLDLNTAGSTPTAGTPTKLTNQILSGAGYSSTPVWAPDNSVIYIAAKDYSGSNYQILSISPTTANQASGTAIYTVGSYFDLNDVTPDGSKLIYQSSAQLYTVTTSGASNTNINNNSSSYYGGYFSPDGTKVLATKLAGSTYYLITMNPDGSAENALVTSASLQDIVPFFRPYWSTSQTTYGSSSNSSTSSSTAGVADTSSVAINKLKSSPLGFAIVVLGLLSLISMGAYWLRTELKSKK